MKSHSLKLSTIAICVLFLLAGSQVLLAQKGASKLEGSVKDPSGSVIPGASVTALSVETNIARESFTNEEGYYVFPSVPAGSYTVSVELTGFKKAVIEKIKLDIAATTVQNFTLAVGDISETVVVTGASVAPIQTTTSDIADTVREQTIQLLPLNGRQPLDLIALNAGVAGNAMQSERGSAASQGTNYAGLGANGARAVSNAVYLDGVDITNSELGTGSGIGVGTELLQSVDAIGEFRVISSNPTAEFGKNSGLQVEIVTRSGTNNLRGSVYDFHRNTVLNANRFFNNSTGVPRGVLLRNQFGGTVGGPVYFPWLYNGKNRTFFFASYERFRQSQGETVERTVFTPEARAGNFRFNSKGPNSTTLVDPITGQVLSQFAGQIASFKPDELDKTRWDGIGKDTSGITDRYIKLMPLPNFFGNPGGVRDGLNFASFRFNAPAPETRDNFVTKIDHQLFSRHQISGRYSHGRIIRNANNSPFPGLPSRKRGEQQRGVALSLVSAIKATSTNEARLGFSRNRRTFSSTINPGDILVDCDSSFDCLGVTNPDLTGEASQTARQTWQFTDNFSWGRGSHQFKAGFTFRSTPLNVRDDSRQINLDFNTEPRNQQGSNVNLAQLFGTQTIPINTNERILAANYFNFITGRMGGVISTFNAADEKTWGPLGSARVRGFRQREIGLFLQDDWRATKNLTLNMGLRYELFFVPFEVNSFWTTPINRNLLDPQIDVNLVSVPIEFGTIGPKNGKQIYPDDYNNFAPSFGFSWDPFGDGKTAIRGAYRVSYDKLFTGTFNTIDEEIPGLSFNSVINGDALRDAGLFTLLAPGGLNAGQKMTPRFANLNGTSVGGITLNGTFNLAQFLGLGRDKGGNLPSKPLGPISETRQSASPFSFTRDFRTAYGQSWSFSIQREISKSTVVEVRYVGRKGTKEYLGLPANEFRAPAGYVKEIQELQYLLTGGSLGLKPATLPDGFTPGSAITIGQLFGSSPTNATNFSQFVPGKFNSFAFKSFPLLYPFFLAGNNAFDNSVASPIIRNDYVSTLATIDNSTNFTGSPPFPFLASVPPSALPSGKGFITNLGPNRTPAADPRFRFGALPIIVGIQPNIFRPNPQFLNGPRVTGNAAFSNYHAFQFQIQRRFYKGLQFQGNYTLSKNFDITSVSQPTGQDVVSFSNAFQDYAVSDNDVTHNMKVNFIWDVPVGRDRTWGSSMHPVLNHIIGGWQIAGFFEASTDFPYNIAVNGRDRTAAASTGGIRPSFASGFKSTGDTNDLGKVQKRGNGVFNFDPSDFNGILARTLIGELGNVDRNFWRGPGFWNVDLNINKVFKIDEARQFEFRAEFFNLFNHANFANPTLNADNGPYVDLSKPDAGKIIETLGNPRLVQFALKFKF